MKEHLRSCLPGIMLVCSALFARDTPAQPPALPDGAQSHWVVGQPHEIVAYLVFDPATVRDRLPETLRFITVKELATGNVRWATDHLAEHPAQADWGISFLEIVRTGTFTIDGAECKPIGPVTGGGQAAGMQAFYPPRSSTVKGAVRVAFAGHREQECGDDSSWTLRGTHPLARGVVLRPSTYQFGYNLKGGAYP